MRLDKFLKVSRLIKRRSLAKEACDAGRVSVNGKIAKASVNIAEGDIITINFSNNEIKARVINNGDSLVNPKPEELYERI